MNSSKSIVPSPFTSYSITNPRISSSVGFCPIDRNTGKSSFVVMVPLPSFKKEKNHEFGQRNVEKIFIFMLLSDIL